MSISSAVKPYTFSNGTKANATQVNSNFDTVYTGANAAIAALNNAAGSKSSLDGRLDVSMNADGTMKAAITAGGEWINPELTPTYVSKNSFTVTGDQTDIYLADRMLRIVLASSTIYRMVSTSTYSAGTDATTVTLVAGGSDVTNPITSVEHGVISPVSSNVSSINAKSALGYNVSTINIASTIVARDGSGNFAAGTVTANLTGNVTGNLTGTASSATNADTVDSQHAAMLAPPGAITAFALNYAPTGWLECNGQLVSRVTYMALYLALTNDGYTPSAFTVTIASPAVFTRASHFFYGGERLRLSTTGALPTGLNTTSDFFVERIDDNTFYLHTTEFFIDSSTRVITTGTQSGTHTYKQSLWGLGNGSTTFRLPDLRGEFLRGWDHGRGLDSRRAAGTWQDGSVISHRHIDGSRVETGSACWSPTTNVASGQSLDHIETTSSSAPYTSYEGGTETRPRNLAVMYCIKT